MCLRSKPISPKKSPTRSRPNCRPRKNRESNASPRKTARPISLLCKRTIFRTRWRTSRNSNKASNFTRGPSSSIQCLLSPLRYSQLESWIVHTFERTVERREKARTLAQQALQLQPDLPEAHLAMGFSLYYGDNNFEGALKEFEIAQRDLPNEAEGYLALGSIQRRLGKWPKSTANLEKAASLTPKDSWVLQNLARSYA